VLRQKQPEANRIALYSGDMGNSFWPKDYRSVPMIASNLRAPYHGPLVSLPDVALFLPLRCSKGGKWQQAPAQSEG
jgi:hypothetical protein